MATLVVETTEMSVVFLCFYFKKVGKFAASIERSKAKSVSASGGLCPWTSIGLHPQTLL